MAEGNIRNPIGINENVININPGDNLNNYGVNKSGFYFLNGGRTEIDNCPSGYTYMIVMTGSTLCCQIVFGDSIFVRRMLNANTWDAWKSVTLS